jgi:hypothetical protein
MLPKRIHTSEDQSHVTIETRSVEKTLSVTRYADRRLTL